MSPGSKIALHTLFVAVGFQALALADSRPADWSTLARRFTGESDEVRERSLESLRKTPDLEGVLRSALGGSDKFLALDVIATLELGALYPDLIRLSEKDGTGYFYHALNALVTPANRAEIVDLYRTRAMSNATPAPAKLALIDTLARLQSALPQKAVATLLADPAYEVREATIAYIRSFLRAGDRGEYIGLLERPLRDGPFQLRIQVLLLASELSRGFTAKLAPGWSSVLNACAAPDRFSPPLDSFDERALCERAQHRK